MLYIAVPASTWPQIEGVTVLKSEGQDGWACCESHVGWRDLVVRVSTSGPKAPLAQLGDALADAGWTPTRCAWREPRSRKRCAESPGFFAVLSAPRSEARARQGIVLVDLQRSPV